MSEHVRNEKPETCRITAVIDPALATRVKVEAALRGGHRHQSEVVSEALEKFFEQREATANG